MHSWALAPTGTDPSEPSSRPNLTYEMAPGTTTEDSVTLWNYGNTQLTFRVYATDAFNNSEGGFDLLAGDKTPADLGAWVRLPQANVTVAAGTKIDLPFTLTVPPDARPGDHAAAILASSEIDGVGADAKIVKLDRRTGSRLYLRVAGPLTPGMAVEELRTAYRPALNPLNGSVEVSYTVRNVGNVRLGARQLVTLRSPFGMQLMRSTLDDIAELLPGGTVVVRSRLTGVAAAVRVAATVTVTPFPVGQPEASGEAVRSRRQAWAIPWSVCGLVLVAFLAWLRRRRQVEVRRRRDDMSGSGHPGDEPGAEERDAAWLPPREPEVTSRQTASKQSLRPALFSPGFPMVRRVTSDAPRPAAPARLRVVPTGRFFRSRRAAWSCAATTALFLLVIIATAACSEGDAQDTSAGGASTTAPPASSEGARFETEGIPARVEFSGTTGLDDGDEVKVKVTADPGSQVFGFEAFLCLSNATYRFDADVRPTLLGKCVAKPLSPRSNDYLEVPAPPPFESVEAAFRVGVGTDSFTRDDGKPVSITCGPADPCRLVVMVQYPDDFGLVSHEVDYR